ncbi:hypothetical protein, partial [Allomesorhizobium camelthorni]
MIITLETGNFSGVDYELLGLRSPSALLCFGDEAMAVEWTITIEGKNEFGDVCRREMRITKSWESLFDGDNTPVHAAVLVSPPISAVMRPARFFGSHAP